MRWVFRAVFLILILIPISVIGAAFLAIEDQPMVQRDVQLTPDEVQRAKTLFQEHDPRTLQNGEVKTMTISQQDLSLASNYLVHLLGGGGSVVTVTDGYLVSKTTVKLPKNPVGEYINVDLGLAQTRELPQLVHLRIGRLEIPIWIAEKGLQLALNQAYAETGSPTASEVIHKVAIHRNEIQVTYQWDANITDVVRNMLVSPDDQERLKAYHQRLTQIAANIGSRSTVSLVTLMQPLFALAQERSKTGDAVQENRAVVLVLSDYINGRGLRRLSPDSEHWPQPVRHKVTLAGRKDFSQHFIISATLSMEGGNLFSNAIGLMKEVDDSRSGSGFSFTDLGADMAGTRFGLQVTTPTSASHLQQRLANSVREQDLMPEVSDLPEGLSEPEFVQRFGGVDSPRYNQLVAKIDRRVAGLSLYR